MRKDKILRYIIVLTLCLSFAGCSGLQRKFTRKKKKEDVRLSPIVTTFDYSKELRVDELYKKHFLFWKTWQSELIDRLDATHKKRVVCYDYTLSSLGEMKKYLSDPKAEELEQFIVKIKSIDPDIRERGLSKSEKRRIRQLLENTKRQIDKNFSYLRVKDVLTLRKPR